jgi:hypothetical protein
VSTVVGILDFKIGTDVQENKENLNMKYWEPRKDHKTEYGAVQINITDPGKPLMEIF